MRKKKQEPLTNGISLLPFLEEFHSKDGSTDLHTMVDDALMSLHQNGYIKAPRRCLSYGKFVIKDVVPTGKVAPGKDRDFLALAEQMINLFPRGVQPGTGYPWRLSKAGTVQRLQMLLKSKDLNKDPNNKVSFTDEEALRATRAYVATIPTDRKTRILKYFIIKQIDGHDESDLLTWIEITKDMTEEEMQQRAPQPLEEADLL